MLVEIAILLPIIFLMVAAFIELSRTWMLKQTADSAAYEGARAAIVAGATPAEGLAASEDLLKRSGIKSWTVTIEPTLIEESTTYVTVRVRIPVAGNTWIAPFFFRENEVTSFVTLITERPPAVQLSGIENNSGGVLGVSALGIGL
jgi:Flp pilus assembly protein TadG